MKLSAITLGLIASGLFSIAKAVDNMAEEARVNEPLVDSTEKLKSEDTAKESKPESDPLEEQQDSTEMGEEQEEESAADRKKRIRKEKRLAKKQAEAEEAAKAKKDEDEGEDEGEDDGSFLDDEDPEITAADVKKALVGLAKAKGNAAAKKILTKFKAANISGLKESDYPEVMELLAEAME